ncbi:hypothetical protein MMC09_004475 [Bachmanniomyces sp. S44760]|nr:hypothetical protein [Bachmanniomyces sp. S44760]
MGCIPKPVYKQSPYIPSNAPTSPPPTSQIGYFRSRVSPSTSAYLSDNEYQTSSGLEVSNPDDKFALELDFGALDPPIYRSDTFPSLNGVNLDDVPHEDTTQPADSKLASESPLVLSKDSSHLLSPDLTEKASPSSGQGINSPLARMSSEGGGLLVRLTSQSNTKESVYPSILAVPTRYMATSTETHPNTSYGGAVQPLSRTASPVVRIESYSREDSPTREGLLPAPSNGKRRRSSHSSSYLAARQEDISDDEANTAKLSGLDPTARLQLASRDVPNFRDQEETAQSAAKTADVEDWLARSETGSKPSVRRQRARSTADPRSAGEDAIARDRDRLQLLTASIPGPGLLIDEDSGEDWEEEGEDAEDIDVDENGQDESADAALSNLARNVSGSLSPKDPLDVSSSDNVGGPRDEPITPFDSQPWQDPIYFPSMYHAQPTTSNLAIMRFQRQAQDIETASRAATWGTRRMSESDLEKVFGPEGLLHRLSLSRDKEDDKGERRGSFLEQAAAKLLPKRSNSNRRKGSGATMSKYEPRPAIDHSRKASIGSIKGSSSNSRRHLSVSKPKSPALNTGGAVAAMTSHLAAFGGSTSMSPTTNSSPTGAWNTARNVLKRRGRAESYRPSSCASSQPGLADLLARTGGPAVLKLTSPPPLETVDVEEHATEGDDDGGNATNKAGNEKAQIDFAIRNDVIIPTFEGFRANVQDVNPRLPLFLTDRIAQEQLRRYKKLVELKVEHAQAITRRACGSGLRCPILGTGPTPLPFKGIQKEAEHSHTGFTSRRPESSEVDLDTPIDELGSEIHFSLGVPIPPSKRLPSEFECPLCFKVKTLYKPSDWSKHVHEDLQPFTCTFPNCGSEPKSFKRKADWVRHENEKHRQLEWWECSFQDCPHICYRRDNFVQHLVREHKLPEPKVKTIKPDKRAVRGPAKTKARAMKAGAENEMYPELDIVLKLVEDCRQETPRQPIEEPCKFCGNVCNSWKKLTVHLARHMEQISIPILKLIEEKEVSSDMILSPIEQCLGVAQSSVKYSDTPQNPNLYAMSGDVSEMKREVPASLVPMAHLTPFSSSSVERTVNESAWVMTGQQDSDSTYQKQYLPRGHTSNNQSHDSSFDLLDSTLVQHNEQQVKPQDMCISMGASMESITQNSYPALMQSQSLVRQQGSIAAGKAAQIHHDGGIPSSTPQQLDVHPSMPFQYNALPREYQSQNPSEPDLSGHHQQTYYAF